MEKLKIISQKVSDLRHGIASLLFTVKKEEMKLKEILQLLDEAIDGSEIEDKNLPSVRETNLKDRDW